MNNVAANTGRESPIIKDSLGINIAIGTLTLYITALLLYILNYSIFYYYHPDTAAIVKRVLELSVMEKQTFLPEPVERLQFQLSVVCSPLFIFIAYNVLKRLKNVLSQNPSSVFYVNLIGINVFILYVVLIFQSKLLYIGHTTPFFFANNLIYSFNFVIGLIFYAVVTYFFLLYARATISKYQEVIIKIICFQIVALICLQLILYNVFQLATQDYLRTMETNAVFYSITQVFAGKSLLVNVNCQYGLYAWFLNPWFKLIGLTLHRFSITMGLLNAFSFLLIYMAIRKMIKQDLLALITFLALIFWQYWQTKLPFDGKPRFYFQYWPTRFLFPSVAFYLIVQYFTGSDKMRRIILPVLVLISAFAVLWNFDSGFVVFGAVLLTLIFSSFYAPTWQDSVKKSLMYTIMMVASLAFAIAIFMFSTKVKSGSLPDFKHFLDYQNFFYVSGYYMLAMSAMHFWNLPILVYLIAGIYCVSKLRKTYDADIPVLAFLFILGLGLFTYFQGRSYDTNLTVVIYPAIIIAGIFCGKLLPEVTTGKLTWGLGVVLFFIPFLFLADGAFSMVGNMPAMHTIAWDNTFQDTAIVNKAQKRLLKRMNFVTTNVPKKDTVLILASDYESYYYAAGSYYNPAIIPSSTEVFFRSELYSVLDLIKTRKYPIIYDAAIPPRNVDTILSVLAKNTFIDKELKPDRTLFLLRPIKYQPSDQAYNAGSDAHLLYHYHRYNFFNNYFSLFPKLVLPDTFTMEFYINKLDTTILSGACWIFSSSTSKMPFSGIMMAQKTDDLTAFAFAYGNGTIWCQGPLCKLSCSKENHLVIKVQKNLISVYNNNNFCGTVNTGSVISNSDGIVNLNADFPGIITEVKIWAQ